MTDVLLWAGTTRAWDAVNSTVAPIHPENDLDVLLKNGATINMNVNGGSTAVAFEYPSPEDKVSIIHRSLAVIVDAGIRPAKFGGLSALSNGLLIEMVDTDTTTILKDHTADIAIKRNYDFYLLAGIDAPIIDAAGDDAMPIRWSHYKDGGPILLEPGQIFRVTVRDDLRNITEMYWKLKGGIFNATQSQPAA